MVRRPIRRRHSSRVTAICGSTTRGVLILLAVVAASVLAEGTPADEAALMAPDLAKENAGLVRKVAGLEGQVRDLTMRLAQCMAGADVARATTSDPVAGRPVSGAAKGSDRLAVVDFDPALGMVVLDGGRRQGVVAGSAYAVLRGDRVMGRVSVVALRDRIAGAIPDEKFDGVPMAGDRAVLAR